MLITASILSPFSPDKETEVETDASGHAVGGALYQFDGRGEKRPCAYFSKKMSPAEVYHPIFDKELLAIVRCLEEWDPHLQRVGKFKVVTDHQNLQYFSAYRRVSERHMRWQEFLNRFSFTIQYRPGIENNAADSLSRREQGMPADATDERLKARKICLLPETLFETNGKSQCVDAAPVAVTREEVSLEKSWSQGREGDEQYAAIKNQFTGEIEPFHLKLVSISS